MASVPHMTQDESRDGLTGLFTLEQARAIMLDWQNSWPLGPKLCPMHAMLITLGRIDTVNVAFGETVGDGALVEVAQRINRFADDELESGVWLAAL